MEKEKINEFTRRITQSNRGEMIVIEYDIFFTYIEDAIADHKAGRYENFKDNIRNADRVLARLQSTLNFEYPIAAELYPLYTFARKSLMMSIVKNNAEGLEDAQRIMRNLYAGFTEAAKQDHSEPLMHNTQQVYAGMTYDRKNLTESFHEPGTSRGFLA